MRTVTTTCSAVLLLVIGYLVGASGGLRPTFLFAQEAAPPAVGGLSDDSRAKIKVAADALKAAMEALQLEQRYNPATKGMNVFAILTGRCTAAEDLEAGRGVDPETFVALNLDLATDELQSNLGKDAEGKLTYKGTLVRLLPKSTLHQMYVTRAAITGEDLPIAAMVPKAGDKRPAAPKKPAEEKTEE